MLYSELKNSFKEIFDLGDYPQTLIFSGGSAYVRDLRDTVENIMIKQIEDNLANPNMTPYQDSENRRTKKRLMDIYMALKDKKNWDINIDLWRYEKAFYSHKLSY